MRNSGRKNHQPAEQAITYYPDTATINTFQCIMIEQMKSVFY